MFIVKNKHETQVTMLEIQRSEKTELNLHKFLLFFLSGILVYQYFVTQSVPESKIYLLGPYNTTFVNSLDVYDQLLDIKNFTFLVNPQPCQDYAAGILIIVIVSSRPTNFANRMVIRNTWGQSVDSTKLVFLLGETDNNTISDEIASESRLYEDVVQGNFVDAYRNMTYKHFMGLKWVTHHCPTAKYIVKTDDDTVVNIHELRKFLGLVLSPFGAKGLIMCHTYEKAPVMRNEDSKWRVTLEEYRENSYPTYCAGWAILYSQDVISQLLEAAQSTSYFWIDDVQVTGICAQKIGVIPTSLSDLILTRDKTDRLIKLGPGQFGPFLFGPPDLTFLAMVKIWNSLSKDIVPLSTSLSFT